MLKTALFLIVVLILSNIVSGEDWIWRNPLPSINSIWGLEEITPSGSMIAVGKYGSIHLTDDNWNSFTRVEVPQEAENMNFSGVDFPTSSIGYISGSYGCLLKSINGGKTWRVLRTGADHEILNSVDFNGNDFGIAVGSKFSMSLEPKGMIACTYNGGDNWNIIEFGKALRGIEVITSTKAVAVGADGTIIMTENSGSNWMKISGPTSKDLNGVVFIDSNIGLAVGLNNTVLRSVDGGYSWTVIDTPAPSTVRFFDIDFGYSDCGAYCVVAVGDNSFEPITIVSHDMGLTWTEVSSDAPNYLTSVSHCGNLGFTAAGCWGAMIGSDQNGEIWESLFPGFYIGINNYDFISDSIGFCVGYDGLIAKTVNCGIDWEVIETGLVPDNLFDVSFSNPRNGIVVGNSGRIMYTNDGGTSWHVSNYISPCPLKGVEFVTGNTAFAIGEEGILLKSEDNGINWNRIELPGVVNNLNDICFIDHLFGFICGDADVFLKTEDGGNTWISVPRTGHAFGTMNCVDFINTSYGFCAGWGTKIIRTTDGGYTWKVVLQGVPCFLWKDIEAVDRHIALATGASGTVVYTKSGGEEWISVSPQTGTPLNAIYYQQGTDRIFTFGGRGAILTNDYLINQRIVEITSSGFDQGSFFSFSDDVSNGISINVSNPVSGNFMASITNSATTSQKITCFLYSLDGRLITKNSVDATAANSFSVSLFDSAMDMPSGLYAIVFEYNNMQEVRTVVLVD